MNNKIEIKIPDNNIFKKKDLSIGKVNLLYGNNGAGKTMLSRAFAFLDTETNPFANEIKETLKDSLNITPTTTQNVNKTIVFNSDFVDYYFSFKDSKAIPSFNLKNDNNEFSSSKNDLKKLEEDKNKNLQILRSFQSQHSEAKVKVETELNSIHTTLQNLLKNNTYPKITGYTNNFTNKLPPFAMGTNKVSEENYNLAHEALLDASSGKEVIIFEIHLEKLLPQKKDYNELKDLLEEKIDLHSESEISNYIKNLNSDKIDWIKTSLDYIKENDNECPLCKQKLDLKDYISGYFDYFKSIEESKISKLSELKLEPVDLGNNEHIHSLESKLLDNSKKDCSDYKKKLFTALKNYNAEIESTNKKIKEKQNSPSTPLVILPYAELTKNVISSLNQIKLLIKKHNTRVEEAGRDNKNNFETIIKYKVQTSHYTKFKSELEDILAWKLENNIDSVLNSNIIPDNENIANIDYIPYTCTDIIKKIKDININIENIEDSLTDKKDASDEINKKLKELWGYEKIKLKLNKESASYNINLYHNGNTILSPSLSEGEKTSISFAYFLIKLKSLMDDDKNQNLLIYIDDPISSLDNYITYQVSEVLNNLKLQLKQKEQSNTSLFLSTHNWYLFYLLNRHKPFSKESLRFQAFKNKEHKTVITEFKHNTTGHLLAEYPLIFKEVYNFSKISVEELYYGSNNECDIFGMSNKARKILENFVCFKYGNKWDDEAISIKDPLSIESHDFTGNHNDYYIIHSNIIKIINYIKEKDKQHYDAMTIE